MAVEIFPYMQGPEKAFPVVDTRVITCVKYINTSSFQSGKSGIKFTDQHVRFIASNS